MKKCGFFSPKTIFDLFRQWLVITLLALWWGGFTFYSVFVVHTGHFVLKSKLRQGFITQLVTKELNWLAVLTLAVVLWDIYLSHREGVSARLIRFAWASWGIMAVCLLVLFILHPDMDALLDGETRTVIDDDKFYRLHDWYLIVSTIEWLAAWSLLMLKTGVANLMESKSPAR
jgi:hypothetical protein